MTYFFKINGETPSKKNSRIINTKTGRSFPSKKYSQWHELALSELIPQKIKNKINKPLSDPMRAHFIFIHGDRRRRDSDNGTSSVLDLFTDARILEDDNYNIIKEIEINNEYEKGAPACFVILQQITETKDSNALKKAIEDFLK